MGKKKKTLEQKKLAQLRRLKEFQKSSVAISSVTTSPDASDSIQLDEQKFSYSFAPKTQEKMVPTYSLQHDLQKTVIVSSVILLILISFSLLLHSNTFVLPLIARYGSFATVR